MNESNLADINDFNIEKFRMMVREDVKLDQHTKATLLNLSKDEFKLLIDFLNKTINTLLEACKQVKSSFSTKDIPS